MDRAERTREGSSRPAKRPRPLPDGFERTPSTNKRTVPTPVFHSDFSTTGTTARRGEWSGSAAKFVRPLLPPSIARPDFGSALSNKSNDANSRVLAKRQPPSFSLSGIGKPHARAGAGDGDGGSHNLVRASALSLAFASPAKEKGKEKEEEREEKTRERESNTSRMLYNPPTTTHTSTRNSHVSLKPILVPPPLPLPRPQSTSTTPSKMKTISTTRVALATDPHTESGSSELFSLFLRHQGGGGSGGKGVGVYGDSVDRELGRGLEVSPEKGRREGRGRFVRGGLAEAFSRRFAESDTDQKLWEEYTARSYKHAAGKVKVKADMKLRTTKLLHRTPLPQNTIHPHHKPRAPVVTLARCLVLDSPSHTNEGEFGKGKEVTVLFRHSYSGSALGMGMGMGIGKSSSVDMQLREGIEVHVWRPWLELSSPSNADVGVPGPVWMCSRFHVVQGDGGPRAS